MRVFLCCLVCLFCTTAFAETPLDLLLLVEQTRTPANESSVPVVLTSYKVPYPSEYLVNHSYAAPVMMCPAGGCPSGAAYVQYGSSYSGTAYASRGPVRGVIRGGGRVMFRMGGKALKVMTFPFRLLFKGRRGGC